MSISAQPSAWKLQQIASSRAEALDRPCEDFLRLLVVELDGGFARLEFVHDQTQLGRFDFFVDRVAAMAESSLATMPAFRRRLRRPLAVSTCDRNQVRVGGAHAKMRERFAAGRAAPGIPRTGATRSLRPSADGTPAHDRLADRRVLAQPAAQDNVERLERLAVRPAAGRALQVRCRRSNAARTRAGIRRDSA